MDVKTRLVDFSNNILEEYDIDLSNRPVSPCNECLVSIMCKKLCPDVTNYLFDYETYDRALEKTLIQCATNYPLNMEIFELRSHRKGEYKKWVVRTYRGRIQSFKERNKDDKSSTGR